MTTKKTILVLGAGLSLGVTAAIAGQNNPFHFTKLHQGYQNKRLAVADTTDNGSASDDDKKGDGKCANGKCAAGKCGS